MPLEVAEHAARLKAQLTTLKNEAPARFASDVETALALCEACRQGALANVRINVAEIKDEAFKGTVEARAGDQG